MKILIIRFSSFGDIAQGLPVVPELLSDYPKAEIHWAVREDFKNFLQSIRGIHKVWSVPKKSGLKELLSLARDLKKEGFTHIYDAHSNLRSHLLCFFLLSIFKKTRFVRRPKDRIKRFLLFKLGINLLPTPFRGTESYRSPIRPWLKTHLLEPYLVHLREKSIEGDELKETDFSESILLSPSAAWPLKRWPVDYWIKLIQVLSDKKFILLGGPEDLFLNEIQNSCPDRVLNFAGKLSWSQTAFVISKSKAIISNDTGALHLADVFGKKAIALIGPTAFGYPSYKTSYVLETKLSCKPCTKDGRGQCKNKEYLKCLRDITPGLVAEKAKQIL